MVKKDSKKTKHEDDYEPELEFSEEISDDDDYDSDSEDFIPDLERKNIKKQIKRKTKKDESESESSISKSVASKNKELKIKEKKAAKEKKVKEPKQPKEKKIKEPKPPKEKKVKQDLDLDYNLNQAYFYAQLSINEKARILEVFKQYYDSKSNNKQTISEDSSQAVATLEKDVPNLRKGKENVNYMLDTLDAIAKDSAKKLNSEIFALKSTTISRELISTYLEAKPTIRECYFFPNVSNEIKVANMLRTCKQTLDVAIFALTNDKIGASIEEAFKRGVKVRLIADDECAKFPGGEVYRLASLGIPTKTDNSFRYHMHHKFAILDNSVVVTGSFNWTSQAVKYNQENILFLECPEIAKQYTEAYNNLWTTFETSIDVEKALSLMKDQADKKATQMEERKKLKEEAKAKEIK